MDDGPKAYRTNAHAHWGVQAIAFAIISEHPLSQHRIAPCVGNPPSESEPRRARVWGGVSAHYLLLPSSENAILPNE